MSSRHPDSYADTTPVPLTGRYDWCVSNTQDGRFQMLTPGGNRFGGDGLTALDASALCKSLNRELDADRAAMRMVDEAFAAIFRRANERKGGQ